jgi:ABC-type cobalamin/Fe3+-siderophores transport system ATPase subunit
MRSYNGALIEEHPLYGRFLKFTLSDDELARTYAVLDFIAMERSDAHVYAMVLRGFQRHLEYWEKAKADGYGPFKDPARST